MPFNQVPEFQQQVLGRSVKEKGLLADEELALICRQLREEIQELDEAHQVQDYIGSVDALIDLLYFGIGGLHRLGLTPEEMQACFAAVHECNMSKNRGVKVRDGVGSYDDAVKPENWVGPEERIAEILGARA